MGFYVIDKYNTVNISEGYFEILSKKYFHDGVSFFDRNSFNKNFEVLIFVYDYEDFINIIEFSELKFKIVVMSKFFLNELKQTENIDYIFFNEFVFNLKNYILKLKNTENCK